MIPQPNHVQPSRWRKQLKQLNLFAGLAGHALLTIALLTLVLVMWYRGSGGAAEPRAVTDARAAAILRNLRVELAGGQAADTMQNYFPEGACFLYTLYGLGWANLAQDDNLRAEALPEILRALTGQETPTALEPFRWDTTVRRGAFWLGQRNLLLAKYLELSPADDDLVTSLTLEFHENARDLHHGFMSAPHHAVDSYEGMCWPADHPAGLVSLTIHDDMFGTTYSEALAAWKNQFQTNGWNNTVLPPGRLDAKTGHPIEPARGCANSLMIALLADTDPQFAAALYRDYQKHFQIVRCGFAMFREYPAGATGFAPDVDSGPIVMDAGVTATGVGLAATRAVGNTDAERDIRDLSEMFGFPRQRRHGDAGNSKTIQYLWGALPIGDAFLAWGWSIPRAKPALTSFAPPPESRWLFHGIVIGSLVLILGQWAVVILVGRRRWGALN